MTKIINRVKCLSVMELLTFFVAATFSSIILMAVVSFAIGLVFGEVPTSILLNK